MAGAGSDEGLHWADIDGGLEDIDKELAGVGPGVEVVEVSDVVELAAWGSGGGGEGDDKNCKLT